MHNNVKLSNNLCKTTKIPTTLFEYGSAIFAGRFSYINMHGGEISNNVQEFNIKKIWKKVFYLKL